MTLPKHFIENIKNINIDWLNNLENLIHYFAKKWQLSDIKHFENLSYNYVAQAYSQVCKTDLVLKICLPGEASTNEQKALLYFNGNGCVKLLDYDLQNFAMLLEAIKPGKTLKEVFSKDENKLIETAAGVIKKLHANKLTDNIKLNGFPTINQWVGLLNNFQANQIPNKHLIRAKELALKLLSSQTDLYLLHGDLHDDNILQKGNDWVAIDPKGVVGELAYEIAVFIRVFVPFIIEDTNSFEIINNRINQFSKIFNIEKQRLIDWSYVQSVLAACWAIEDNSKSYKNWLKLTELIESNYF